MQQAMTTVFGVQAGRGQQLLLEVVAVLGAVLLTLDRCVLASPDHTVSLLIMAACMVGERAAAAALSLLHAGLLTM